MPTEIERKFLVHRAKWKPVTPGVLYRQGYLSSVKERVVRVRIAGEKAYFTVKGISENLSRLEFEYPIPVTDAAIMLDKHVRAPANRKDSASGNCR
jgi:adenylate cyclase